MVPIYTQFLRVITYANMPQELRIVKNMSYFLCFCTNFVHILNQILQRYSKNRIFMTCSHCLERERSQGTVRWTHLCVRAVLDGVTRITLLPRKDP